MGGQYTLLEKVNSNAKVCVPFVAPKCVTETGATNAKCSQVASPSPTNCSNKYYAPGKKCAYHKGVDSSTADAGNLPNCSGTDSPTHECVCNTTANSETYLLPGSTKRCSAPGVGGELVDVCNKTNGEKPTGTTGEKCWCQKTATKHDFATIGTDTCKTDVNTAASCKDQHGYDGDANCSAVDVTLYQGQDATACTNTMDESGVACVATFASGNNPSAEVVGDCVGKTKVERTCKCGKVGGDANGAVQYIKPTDNKVCSAGGAAADSKAISPCATTKYYVKEPTKSSGAGPECACPKTATEYNLISSHATTMEVCVPYIADTCVTETGATNPICSQVVVTGADDAAKQTLCGSKSYATGKKCVYAPGRAAGTNNNVGDCTALEKVDRECKCGKVGGDANGAVQYIKPTDNKVCSAAGAAADSKAISPCATTKYHVKEPTKSSGAGPECACPKTATEYNLISSHATNMPICKPQTLATCKTVDGLTNDANCS